MRTGTTLTVTVLLFLILGASVWGLRHWHPEIICKRPSLDWLCTGPTPTAQISEKEQPPAGVAPESDVVRAAPEPDSQGATEAHPFPWPVADAPIEWTNVRTAATDATEPAEADADDGRSRTEAHPFPWPVADAPIAWTNVRTAATDAAEPAEADGVDGGSKTEAHPFPWPVADAPVEWTNVRTAATDAGETAGTSDTAETDAGDNGSKTEAHPFPWPVADAPIEWTNVRTAAPDAAEPAETDAGDGGSKTEAHPFPWPVADAPKEWKNVRVTPQPDAPERQASDCSAELNRVASGGIILFETGSARLGAESYPTLDRLAAVAKICDRVKIVVEGHTDDRGSESFNQSLSEERATSVAAYLRGAGLDTSNVSAVGYGESRPIASNDTAADRARNRRIEFSATGH